jgi:hypothetical protein
MSTLTSLQSQGQKVVWLPTEVIVSSVEVVLLGPVEVEVVSGPAVVGASVVAPSEVASVICGSLVLLGWSRTTQPVSTNSAPPRGSDRRPGISAK